MRKGTLNPPEKIRELVRTRTLNLPEFNEFPRRRERKGRQSRHTHTKSDKVQVNCGYKAPRCVARSNELTEEIVTIVTTGQVQQSEEN